MRKALLLFGGGAALFLFACIVAPNEPAGTSQDGLSCAPQQREFNGSCKQVCAANADCPGGSSCMKVSGDVALCLDYQHCAFLGSDTECRHVGGYGYSTTYAYHEPHGGWSYGPVDPYADPYTYGAAGCQGDAKWQVIAPSGDPECGVAHAVTRCAPVGGGCGLVSGSTIDVADP